MPESHSRNVVLPSASASLAFCLVPNVAELSSCFLCFLMKLLHPLSQNSQAQSLHYQLSLKLLKKKGSLFLSFSKLRFLLIVPTKSWVFRPAVYENLDIQLISVGLFKFQKLNVRTTSLGQTKGLSCLGTDQHQSTGKHMRRQQVYGAISPKCSASLQQFSEQELLKPDMVSLHLIVQAGFSSTNFMIPLFVSL